MTSSLYTVSPPRLFVYVDSHGNLARLRYLLYTPANVEAQAAVPLLLTHGAATRKEYWPPNFIAAFAVDHPVVCKDHRGEGDVLSDGIVDGISNTDVSALSSQEKVHFGYELSSTFNLQDMADDNFALLAALFPQHSKFHCLGLSQGGMITQAMANYYPDRVASVMLLATSADTLADVTVGSYGAIIRQQRALKAFPPASRLPKNAEEQEALDLWTKIQASALMHPEMVFGQKFLKSDAAAATFAGLAAILSPYKVSLHSIAVNAAALFAHNALEQIPADHPLRENEIPVLILHGQCDPLFSLNVSVPRLQSAYPKAQLVTIPDAGHMLHVTRH